MQRKLLDRHSWDSRVELARAIFEWIEGFHNPRGRSLIPVAYLQKGDSGKLGAQHRVRQSGVGS